VKKLIDYRGIITSIIGFYQTLIVVYMCMQFMTYNIIVMKTITLFDYYALLYIYIGTM